MMQPSCGNTLRKMSDSDTVSDTHIDTDTSSNPLNHKSDVFCGIITIQHDEDQKTLTKTVTETGPPDDNLIHQEFFSEKLIERTGSTSTPIVQKTQSRVGDSSSITCRPHETNDSGFTEISITIHSKQEVYDTTTGASEATHPSNKLDHTESDSVIDKTHSSLHHDVCPETNDERRIKKEAFLEKLSVYIAELEEKCPSSFRIGTNIGEEHIDILKQLEERQIPCLSKILDHLSDADLRACKNVSRSWKDIISSDNSCKQRLSSSVPNKEQVTPQNNKNKENKSPQKLDRPPSRISNATPVLRLLRTNSINEQALSLPSQDGINPNKTLEFYEEGQKLKYGEKLTKCPRCSGPAIFIYAQDRGTCKRKNCGFDYCTRCELKFHNGDPCPVGKMRKIKPEQRINSKESKKHLRRL